MNITPFIYKETLHVLRDKRMLLVVLAIPIVMMLLFGFAISMEVNNVRVGVSWQNYGAAEREVIDRLKANPYITLVGSMPQSEIYETMRSGKVDAVVMIKDAEDMQVITDTSNPNIGQASAAYVQAIITGTKANPLIDTHFLWNPQLKSSYNFVPGIMGMLFLLICSLMTAVSIVREKETGTMELLLVSPVKPIYIIVSKMVPFFLISCVDLAIIIILAKYVLDVPISAGLIPILLFSLVYLILSLALGLFVSTIAKSQVTAMLVCGMVMIFPVIMLSGLIYPVENLPIILKQISAIVPARWYIDAMRQLMVEGLSFVDVLREFLILTGMTILLIGVSLRKFNDRLE